jgi:segregation and condensation protein B
MNKQLQIEAIIFASETPVSKLMLLEFFQKQEVISEQEIDIIIEDIQKKYIGDNYAFELINTGGGYQFLTKPDFHTTIATFLNRNTVKRLTTAAIETLAIIAYKQPITKSEVEQIRGVNCDYTIQKLMEKELLEITGRSENVGKPLLYGTTPNFLDYLGINTIEDLPKLKDFDYAESQIGEISISKEESSN